MQLRVGGGVHGDLKQGPKEVVQELSKAIQLTSGLVDVTGVMRFIHTCTYKGKAIQLTSELVDVTGVMRFIHTCTYKGKAIQLTSELVDVTEVMRFIHTCMYV